MILVDNVVTYTRPYHMRGAWCHLWTDGSIEELHQFALRLGLHRTWFQDKAGFPHYDIVPRYREKAIAMGAQAISLKTWLGTHRPPPGGSAPTSQTVLKVLSIREPWASAIIYAGKDIENRTWRTTYRGRLWIHAAKIFDRDGWHFLQSQFPYSDTLEDTVLDCPGRGQLSLTEVMSWRGHVIGSVNLVDCVDRHDSPWFFGKFGFVLEDPQPCKPFELTGRVGIFDVSL